MNIWPDITRATNAQIVAWAEAQPWAREMAACQQDAQWHAEGDVWTHTRMVCAELERLADWPSLDRAAQLKLLFNATNITRQMRGRWIELFADYGARVEVVYIEPPLRTILTQNKRRTVPVPEKVIERLVEKLEPPTITECHELTLV